MRVVAKLSSTNSGPADLGVGICEVSQGQRHVGFVYRLRDDQELRFAHLAFHLLYRDEAADTHPDLYCAPSGLDEINRSIVASWLAALKFPQNIPYGFDSEGVVWHADGEFIPPPPGKGLTCATFLIATLRFLGFNVVDLSSWPQRPEDGNWQDAMRLSIQNYCDLHAVDAQEHLNLLQADVGAVRVRPEEAAAIVVSQQLPVPFEEASALAAQILDDLASH